MSNLEQFSLTPDRELGVAIRGALATHHDGAFLTRVRARLAQRARSWDEELAHWFWGGLAAATAAMAFAGFGLSKVSAETPEPVAETSIAAELLLGAKPGVDVYLVAMRENR